MALGQAVTAVPLPIKNRTPGNAKSWLCDTRTTTRSGSVVESADYTGSPITASPLDYPERGVPLNKKNTWHAFCLRDTVPTIRVAGSVSAWLRGWNLSHKKAVLTAILRTWSARVFSWDGLLGTVATKRKPRKTATTDASPAPSSLSLRPYQQAARDAFYAGKRRQILVWHRRAGKDISMLDFAHERATDEIGTYWHLYPTHVQANRAIWHGIDARAGVRFIDRAFPPAERKSTLKQAMQIELKNGSIWQLCGSDRYDSLVGSNPRGVVFSEWALCDPRAWDYVRPIIRENGGWVAFITTYRGRNFAYKMAKRLANNPDWYVDIRTVEDTTDNDGNRILTDADIQAERDDGMSEALIQQEYYCNPVAALPGAIYGRSIERAIENHRVGTFAYDSSRPVFAAWSTEFADQYSVAYFQTVGNETRVIGSHSYPFESLSEARQIAAHTFPWKHVARTVLPHNAPGEIIETFENAGEIVDLAPDVSNIHSVTRDQLATMYFDNAPRAWEGEAENNERLIDSLNGYRFAEARGGGSYTATPINSWEKYYARTLETFAAFRHSEPLNLGGWHDAPSTALQDRAVI